VNSPLVSIIINNCNYGRFVDQAIESALEQTYSPTEVLVVDDGSTDDSRQVIARFDGSVTAIFKPNGGQASSFNAGFAKCRGDVIVFLDADDLLLPAAVELAVDLFNDVDVVKVHWPMWKIDDIGRRTGGRHPARLVEGDLRDHFIRHGPVSVAQSPTSGNAWARRFLDCVMPLPEHADRHGADGFLRKLAPIYGRIGRLDEPAGCYRIHARSYGGGKSELFNFRRALERYPTYCQLLAEHLRQMGVYVDLRSWMGDGSQYAWLRDAVALHDELSRRIPMDAAVIFIDSDALGSGFLPGRRVTPFLERRGEYWGPPRDDRQAIEELQRTRSEGARWAVLAFPAFWWLETYETFVAYLKEHYPCPWRSERALIFDLETDRTRSSAAAGADPRIVESIT